MHNYFIHCLQLFGFGFLGILGMAFLKMKDINDMNENYTFNIVVNKFLKREWPSYGLSLIIIITAALSHDEWLQVFVDKVQQQYNVTLGVDLFMFLFGGIGQYLIYKKWGKMKTPEAAQKLDAKESNNP